MNKRFSRHIVKATVFFGLHLLGLAGLTTPANSEAPQQIELLSIPVSSGRLAFTYGQKQNADIWVIDFKTARAYPLVASPTLDEYPNWSPEGSRLAFYSDISGDREIYSIAADGTDLRRLTTSPGIDEDPSWSPDGKQIVFHSARLGHGFNLFLMNADGSEPRPLTNSKKQNTVPRFSPDSSKILYSTSAHWPGWDLVLLDLKSREQQVLTRGVRSFCRGSWSPDGESIVFSAGSRHKVDLWLYRLADGSKTPLIERPGRDYDPVWVDNGSFFFAGEITPGKEDYELFYYHVKTAKFTRVTRSLKTIRFLSWTPGGSEPTQN